MRKADVVTTILEAINCTREDFTEQELNDIAESIEDDAHIDIGGYSVNVISEEVIDDLWHDSLIEQIKDCYDLYLIPHFIEIDWDATAENCKIDGLGHHFAHYDHEEHYSEPYYIFRTN